MDLTNNDFRKLCQCYPNAAVGGQPFVTSFETVLMMNHNLTHDEMLKWLIHDKFTRSELHHATELCILVGDCFSIRAQNPKREKRLVELIQRLRDMGIDYQKSKWGCRSYFDTTTGNIWHRKKRRKRRMVLGYEKRV